MLIHFTTIDGGDAFIDPDEISAVAQYGYDTASIWLKGHRDPFLIAAKPKDIVHDLGIETKTAPQRPA